MEIYQTKLAGHHRLSKLNKNDDYRIKANHIFFEDDGFMSMVGFSDEQLEPSQFVIFQQAHEYDEQDKNLGMDKNYIQVEEESKSQYGGIEAIIMNDNILIIQLEKGSEDNLKLDGNIEISLNSKHPDFSEVITQLKEMVKRDHS